MSTTFLGKNLPSVGDYHSSLLCVESRNPEKLGDYVKRIREEKKLSTTEVQDESRKGGAKGISDAYITRIENGYVTNVSPAKLHALAKGLGVSEDKLFAIARGEVETPRRPLIDAELPPDVAADLELMAHMFIDIPRDCQLDTLASMAGIHHRRSISAKIYERHEARAETRAALEKERPQEDERPAAVRAASNITGPVRMTTPLEDYEKGKRQQQQKSEETGQKPDVPAKRPA